MGKSTLTTAKKNRIYQLSVEDGFSQSKLADLYDVSQSTISNVLKDMHQKTEIAELKQSMENVAVRGAQAILEEKAATSKQAIYFEEKDEWFYWI